MTDGHTWGKDKLAQQSRCSTIQACLIFAPPPQCMLVDEDLLKLGAAFYARRIMQPRPCRAAFIGSFAGWSEARAFAAN